jgi:hypothetical protein
LAGFEVIPEGGMPPKRSGQHKINAEAAQCGTGPSLRCSALTVFLDDGHELHGSLEYMAPKVCAFLTA